MKNLEDIKQELIGLEKIVQDVSKIIKSLNYEINIMQEASQKKTQQNVFDFEKIKELSKNISISKHPLVYFGNAEGRQLYIEVLLNMVRLDEDHEVAVNRMIYIQWLIDQSKAARSLRDLFLESMQMTKEMYAQFAKSLKDPLASIFIADALIVAYISGTVSEEVKSYLDKLFAISGLGKDKVKSIASAVKYILSGENKVFPNFRLASPAPSQSSAAKLKHSSSENLSIGSAIAKAAERGDKSSIDSAAGGLSSAISAYLVEARRDKSSTDSAGGGLFSAIWAAEAKREAAEAKVRRAAEEQLAAEAKRKIASSSYQEFTQDDDDDDDLEGPLWSRLGAGIAGKIGGWVEDL